MTAFLTGAEAKEDSFSGQSHQRVADALVEIVGTSASSAAIGLEGTWGAGKSFVIDLARTGFASHTNAQGGRVHLFIFDAWTHQGEPIKRLFLQRLLNWQSEEGIVDSKRHLRLSRLIQSRVEHTTTENTAELSKVGLWAAFYAYFLPVLYLWLSPIAYHVYTKAGSAAVALPAYIFLSLIFIAPIVVLRCIACAKKEPLTRAFSLWFDRTQTDIKKKFIQEEDANSIEFGRTFRSLLSHHMAADTLVVVIDNIDRLPKDELLSMWAFMRSLVPAACEDRNAADDGRFWLVVPYDREYVTSVFSSHDNGRGDVGDQSQSERATKGVLEKTFNLVLRISPPVLSDWKEFLDSLLSQQLASSITEEQKWKIFRVFENDLYKKSTSAKAITPRSIMNLVNSLCLLNLQWKEEIPIECQALYITVVDEIDKDIGRLRNGTILDRNISINFSGVEWQRHLAALYFQVSPDHAVEVLLRDPIIESLRSADASELLEYAAARGFEATLSGIVDAEAETWATETPSLFARACLALESVELSEGVDRSVWRRMASAVSALAPLDALDEHIVSGLVLAIAGAEPDHDEIRRVARGVVAAVSKPQPELAASSDFVALWFDAVDKIHVYLINQGIDTSSERLAVPGEVESYVDAATMVSGGKALTIKNLAPRPDTESVTAELVQRLSGKQVLPSFIDACEQLGRIRGSVDAGKLFDAITERLNSQPIDPGTTANLLKALVLGASYRLFRMDKGASNGSNGLSTLKESGALLECFRRAREASHTELEALSLWALALTVKSGDVECPTNHAQFGDLTAQLGEIKSSLSSEKEVARLVTPLAGLVAELGATASVQTLMLDIDAMRELLAAVYRQLLAQQAVQSVDARRLLCDYERILGMVGVKHEDALFHAIAGLSEKFESVVEEVGPGSLSPSLVARVFSNDGQVEAVVRRDISEYLLSRSGEQWEQALDEEDEDLELLLSVLNVADFDLSPAEFRDPLSKSFERVFARDYFPKRLFESWYRLPDALPKNTRRAFYQGLMRALGTRPFQHAGVYSGIMLTRGRILEYLDPESDADVATSVMIPALYAQKGEKSFGLLMKHAKVLAPCVAQASEGARSELAEMLVAVMKGADDEERKSVRETLNRLNIDPPEVDEGDAIGGNADDPEGGTSE